MVIVRLNGGLGNQLFQYALGRTLAHRRRTRLRFDFEKLDADPRRSYSLRPWNTVGERVTPLEMRKLDFINRWNFRLRRFAPYYKRHVIAEKEDLRFDANVLRAPRLCLLIGYWQSEKYFEGSAELIRREVTLRAEPSGRTREMARCIRAAQNSVFLHIRRGDYVADATTNAFHGTCSEEYYRRAAEHLARHAGQPHFFVFSDEPQWARENLKLPYPVTVVDHNAPGDGQSAGAEHEDLWLMSLCRHAVLANSSFSWWGAWLNPLRERIVIAPQQWLQSLGNDTRDLIPERWTKL